MIEKNNLTIINNGKPTHKFGNILDLAIVSNNILHSTSNFKVNNKYKISDHLPISFELNDMSVEKTFNIVDWPKFKNKIEDNLPLINTIPHTNLELIEKIECFNKLITYSLNRNTKKITSSSSKIKLPPEIIVKIKQKRKLQRNFSKNHSPQTKNELNNISNAIKKDISNLNRKKWNTIYANLIKTQPSESKFWSIINHKNKENIEILPDLPNPIEEKVEIIADHLKNTFSNNAQDKHQRSNLFNYYASKRFNQPITKSEVTETIKNIKSKNSSSFDGISTKIIKNLGDSAQSQMLLLFNASFSLNFVPEIWKTAKITVIHKKDLDPNIPVFVQANFINKLLRQNTRKNNK